MQIACNPQKTALLIHGDDPRLTWGYIISAINTYHPRSPDMVSLLPMLPGHTEVFNGTTGSRRAINTIEVMYRPILEGE